MDFGLKFLNSTCVKKGDKLQTLWRIWERFMAAGNNLYKSVILLNGE